ncbi:MAG: tripartite tricarboxylate transporter TctB family protein [Jannaschia sp.]
MKLNDALLGFVLIAAAVAIWFSAQNFSRLPNQAYGSETMPLALSALAFCLGLFMVAKGVLAREAIPRLRRADWTRTPGAVAGVAVALALVVGYILLSGRLGFIPVAAVTILILMLVMRVRWWVAVPLSALATLAIQQAFGRLLLVPLPRSEVFSFLW